MIKDLKKEVDALASQIVAWRRDFHQHPEVAFSEKRTSEVIRKYLESLGLSVSSCGGLGLKAVLEGRPGGKTVALRSDMDALPLVEEGDKPYISLNSGATHACGHDGHMAIVMTAATILSAHKKELPGRVVFLFQPAEELPPGGAIRMVEDGAVEGVDSIFGLHLWQGLPTGTVAAVKGPMMAHADNFTITVQGLGGHGSMPHLACDPILVASEIVVASQSIVSRNVDPLKPAVVSFGMIQGGAVNNIIPTTVTLKGTVRTFDRGLQALIGDRLKTLVEATARAFGAEAKLDYFVGYPAVVNDPAMTDFALDVARKTLGPDRVITSLDPVMGGEDFAYYLQKVPGAFLFFGAGDGQRYPHHHPGFDIDEAALLPAAHLLTRIALEFLG
jgi:amidohydrolase